jgi:hypothetical protein
MPRGRTQGGSRGTIEADVPLAIVRLDLSGPTSLWEQQLDGAYPRVRTVVRTDLVGRHDDF